MQEIVIQNRPPPEDYRPPPHESNVAQSKHPVNDKPSFDEACVGPDAEIWKRAMLEELQGIEQNEVWRESPLPLDRSAWNQVGFDRQMRRSR